MWRCLRECRPSHPPLLASQDHLQHTGNVVRLFPNKYFQLSYLFFFFSVSILCSLFLLLSLSLSSIGYPVITMSFLIKHHLLHVLRQRQQRTVAEENLHCFQILMKALPTQEDEEDESDRSSNATLEDLASEALKSRLSKKKEGLSKGVILSSIGSRERNHKHSGRSNIGSGSAPSKQDPSPSCKSMDTKIVNGSPGSSTSDSSRNIHKATEDTPPHSTSIGSINNGDVVHPSSASKGQPPSGKKLALVKAVPRTDLQQQTEAREKVCT